MSLFHSKQESAFHFKDFPSLVSSTVPADAAAEMAQRRKPNVDWMKQEPVSCDFDAFTLNPTQNRYVVTHQDVPFECLYLPDGSKKLYVMLCGGGAKIRRYPRFLRWKYQNFLQGNVLCIDDPMYHFHPEFARVMWYYGTKDKPFLHLLLDIVKKAMAQLGIKATDVTFVGSSGGGYASLYCANLLDDSAAIAMNPQLVLKNWDPKTILPHFKKLGIDLTGEDTYGRNFLKLTNPKSRFLLVINAASEWDITQQFTPFAQAHGITPKYGISQNKQIVTWLHHTEYSDMHSVFLEKTGLAFASYLCEKMKEGFDLNALQPCSSLLNEVLYEKYDQRMKLETANKELDTYYQYFLKSISRTIEEALYRRLPMQASPALRRYLDYRFEVETKAWKTGNIGYYIGEQMGYRYNIFYHDGKVYYRMKFDMISEYVSRKAELDAVLDGCKGMYLTRWYYEKNDTLVMTLLLNPDNAEKQIAEFTELTIGILNEYLDA
ncbi:MAG: hypothetical protein E7502_01445 [Ruminococcus sp.]|nr:hypothetical protein [Ruminococcus sp.]